MGTGRKYILNAMSYVPYGIYTSGFTTQYNLTNEFTLTCEGVNLYYNNINLIDLSLMSDNDYEKRVNDFLLYVGVLSTEINDLKTNAIITTPDCIDCLIDTDFYVEKYDTGVQVINYGVGYGELQFAVVNVGVIPIESDWQVNDIFLNVDMNLTYDVYVRDYNTTDNSIYCQLYKTIDFSQFNPIVVKTVSLEEGVYINAFGDKKGKIVVDPPLEDQEKITIDFELGVNSYSNASGYAKVFCKPNNGSVFDPISSICNNSTTNSLTFGFGDDVCYDIQLNAPTYGDTGHSYICLSNIVGSDYIEINSGNTCVGIIDAMGQYDVVLSLNQTYNDNNNGCTVSGVLTYDKAEGIPINECVNVTMNFNKTIVGTGDIIGNIYCKPNGDTIYHLIADENVVQSKTFEICNGDDICYNLKSEVTSANSDINIGLNIDNVSPITIGINPSIGSISCDSAVDSSGSYLISLLTPSNNTSLEGCGIINTTPILYTNDSNDVDINLYVLASKRLPDSDNNTRIIPDDGGGSPSDGDSGGSTVPGGKAISQMRIICNDHIIMSVSADADLGENYSQICEVTLTVNIKYNDNVCVEYGLTNTVEDVTGDDVRDGEAYAKGSISYATNHENYNIDPNNCYFSCSAGRNI